MTESLKSWEQKKVVEWFRKTYPEHKIVMISNDGPHSPAEKEEKISLGLCKGAADLYIPFISAWVEMKRIKGDTWSEDQKEFNFYVEAKCNNYYLLCYGHKDAINQIEELMNDK